MKRNHDKKKTINQVNKYKINDYASILWEIDQIQRKL